MDDGQDRDIGRVAQACAFAAVGSAACLTAYSVIGGPLGTVNDVLNAATGVLGAALAWQLRREADGAANLASAAASVGAAITVAGSALVVSGTTGWFLAGLVSSIGFAGIGAALVEVNRRRSIVSPRGVRRLGLVAGLLMTVGFAAVPGVVLRLDDPATAPGWAWIGSISWLGTYAVLPVWAIWLSRIAGRSVPAAPSSPARAVRTEGREVA